MKTITVVITASLGIAFASASSAEGLKALPYTGVQASYSKADFDDLPIDADGIDVGGFFDIGSNVFVTAGYASGETDDFTVMGVTGSIKISGFTVGLGYHHALNPTVDLVPTVSLIDASTEFQGGFSGIPDEDDTGWSAGVALRALVTPHLELAGGVDYTDLYDDDSNSFNVGAFVYPVDKLGLGVGYDVSDDVKTLEISARVLFH